MRFGMLDPEVLQLWRCEPARGRSEADLRQRTAGPALLAKCFNRLAALLILPGSSRGAGGKT